MRTLNTHVLSHRHTGMLQLPFYEVQQYIFFFYVRASHMGGDFFFFTRHRRPRESEAATFFNSLDENADGVLAEDEIREV